VVLVFEKALWKLSNKPQHKLAQHKAFLYMQIDKHCCEEQFAFHLITHWAHQLYGELTFSSANTPITQSKLDKSQHMTSTSDAL
jgi:hypothetical protein